MQTISGVNEKINHFLHKTLLNYVSYWRRRYRVEWSVPWCHESVIYIAVTLLKHVRRVFLGLVSTKCLLHRDASRAESVSTISEWQLIKWSLTDRRTDGMGKASGRYWRCSVSGSTAPSPCWLETLLAVQLKVQFLSSCSTVLTLARSLKSWQIFSFKDFLSEINLNTVY